MVPCVRLSCSLKRHHLYDRVLDVKSYTHFASSAEGSGTSDQEIVDIQLHPDIATSETAQPTAAGAAARNEKNTPPE